MLSYAIMDEDINSHPHNNAPDEPTVATPLNTFKKYMVKEYHNKSTIQQYLDAAETYLHVLHTEDNRDEFLKRKRHNNKQNKLNPFWKGFVNAVCDCFGYVKPKRSKSREGRQKPNIKFLSKKQIDYILAESDGKIYILTKLFFETGLRLRELINIQRNQINLQDRTITGIGKGNKDFEVRFSERTKKELINWLDFKKGDHPFWDFEDEVRDHARAFWYQLRMFGEKIGFHKEQKNSLHPHRFRHALGHHLRVDKKWDLQQIKGALRHSDLASTDIYTVSSKEEIDKKMEDEVFKE